MPTRLISNNVTALVIDADKDWGGFAISNSGGIYLVDDKEVRFGAGAPSKVLWETVDANANCLIVDLPVGGAVDVPVLAVGIGLMGIDLGMFNGVTEALVAVIDADRDSYIGLSFSADDVAVLRMRIGAAGVVRNHIIPDVVSDTVCLIAATQELDNKTLDSAVGKGTWTASGTWTLPAVTFAGVADFGGSALNNVHNIQSVTTDDLTIISKYQAAAIGFRLYTTGVAAAYTDTLRMSITGGAATTIVNWIACYHTNMKFGLAGTATGAWTMDGGTSGVVTVTVAAVAGTWTMTLPAAVGTAGDQLTDAAGDGICSWTGPLSLSTYKRDFQLANPKDALDAILHTGLWQSYYREDAPTNGDKSKRYWSIKGEESPDWIEHGNKFSFLNAVPALFGAVQAMNDVEWIKAQVRKSLVDSSFRLWLRETLHGE